MSDLSDLLRGTADFIDAVTDAYRERRAGFSEREAGDYLDTAGVDHAPGPDGLSLTHPGGWCYPTDGTPDDVVDAEVHCEGCNCPTICGCGREIYAEYDRPGAPPLWFHRDDDSPITLQCARIPLAEPTAEELAELAARRDVLHVIPDDPSEVSHEDLAAHITGVFTGDEFEQVDGIECTSDHLASSLLADYRITKK
ncbi:hypothetical protein [Mycolicibacterium conceptionense]|uniref:hypothetical protein n=1 Tax=Mycolicibacterium conceptionense TaxID=451644 RepID=UPI00096CF897|nr:hypothetical protein [Mycolicibacterium conceptionense]OMB79227.1 hypothetical protein A5743_14065 [Mycolicibacterium conceptionense]